MNSKQYAAFSRWARAPIGNVETPVPRASLRGRTCRKQACGKGKRQRAARTPKLRSAGDDGASSGCRAEGPWPMAWARSGHPLGAQERSADLFRRSAASARGEAVATISEIWLFARHPCRLAYGAKLWSACSSLPLFRQPACWRGRAAPAPGVVVALSFSSALPT